MADHKIDGNDGVGNVQAPERIWMFAETMKPYISGGGKIMMGDIEYIRAVVAASQLAAANARADRARDKAWCEGRDAAASAAHKARNLTLGQLTAVWCLTPPPEA